MLYCFRNLLPAFFISFVCMWTSEDGLLEPAGGPLDTMCGVTMHAEMLVSVCLKGWTRKSADFMCFSKEFARKRSTAFWKEFAVFRRSRSEMVRSFPGSVRCLSKSPLGKVRYPLSKSPAEPSRKNEKLIRTPFFRSRTNLCPN